MNHTQPKLISEVTILRILRELELMNADTFCDRWFGLDNLTPSERQRAKAKWGHRAKCVSLLSDVLRVERSTINSWGARFERMPERYQVTLTYADLLRRLKHKF